MIIMMNAFSLIFAMILIGVVCYAIGRLTMALDIKWQQKQALSQKQARHLAQKVAN